MSILDREALAASPLADLHALASELSIDGYRRLRKAELIDAILARQGGEAAPAPTPVPDEAEARPRPELRAKTGGPPPGRGGVGAAGAAGPALARATRGRRPAAGGKGRATPR